VPDFDPQKVLIDWKASHGFTIADAMAGVSVMGATGSGKTCGISLFFVARWEHKRNWSQRRSPVDDMILSKSYDERIHDYESGGRGPGGKKNDGPDFADLN
jgi:hypothetical protein